MELDIEQDGNTLKVDSPDRNHTVLNMLKQAVWEEDGQAGYDKGHPYTGSSTLVITADDPETMLDNALDRVKEQLDDVEAAF